MGDILIRLSRVLDIVESLPNEETSRNEYVETLINKDDLIALLKKENNGS